MRRIHIFILTTTDLMQNRLRGSKNTGEVAELLWTVDVSHIYAPGSRGADIQDVVVEAVFLVSA